MSDDSLTSINRRDAIKLGGVSITALSLAGCSNGGSSGNGGNGGGDDGGSTSKRSDLPSTITFGATMPLTGAYGETASWYVEGWELFNERQERITIDGEEFGLDLVVLDNKFDVDQTISNTVQLMEEEGVDIHLGSYGTAFLMAAAQTLGDYGNILMNVGAASSKPANEYGGQNGRMVSPVPPARMYTLGNLQLAAEQDPEPSHVGIVVPDESSFKIMADASENWIEENTEWEVSRVGVPLEASDLSGEVESFDEAGVDYYMQTGAFGTGVALASALRRLDIEPLGMYFGYTILNAGIRDSLGSDARGLLGMNWIHDGVEGETLAASPWDSQSEFVTDIQDTYESLQYHQARGASCQEMALTALQNGVDWNNMSFEEAMSADFLVPEILKLSGSSTLQGPVEFNDIGMNTGALAYQFQRQDDLTPEVVYPPEEATADPLWPFPGWN